MIANGHPPYLHASPARRRRTDRGAVLAKGLREQAYAVDVAGDGEAAIFQVGTTDYDAVILDVMLPLKDGFAVCRAIRDVGLRRADTDGHRSRRRRGANRRARLRRRRLSDQAVRLRRAAGAAARADPPRPPAAAARAAHASVRWSSTRAAGASCVDARASSLTAPRNTRCSSISSAAPATSSAARTSPSTSGTSTTIRCRTSSTSTCSVCGASSIGPGASR